MFRSLHMKLVLIMVLLILSVMLVVGVLLVSQITEFYLEAFTNQMEEVFTPQFLMELEQEANGEDAPERMRSILYAYASALGIDDYRQYCILSADGVFLTGSDMTSGTTLEMTPNIIQAMNGKVGDRTVASYGYADLAIPITAEDTTYIIYVKDSNEDLNEMNWMLVKLVIQVIIFGMIFAILLSILLSKTMTTPLENVTRGAVRLASGAFDSKLEVQSNDEIGKLTSTFNEMAQTLQETLEEVKGERNKLDTLFQHMTDGVAAFDRNLRILHMNPAAEALLGIPFAETLTYQEVFGDMPAIERAPDETGRVEYTHGEKILQVFLAPLNGTEQERGLLAVIHDVTEQQKLERSRREFVASVSHELRTPLTSIKSYTETLRDTPDLTQEDTRSFLDVIDNETDRMARIVKDLLTLSRLERGQFDLRISTFPSGRLLKSVSDAMIFEARSRSQKLKLKLDKTMPMITADRERVEQVVVNILSNAIKYTQNGGQIVLSGYQEEDYLVIVVEDNGVGIPKEDVPRIFERFYRVEKARTRDKGGTGLGLAIVYEIVRYHNGTIDIQSAVDVGTKVTVRLPLCYEQK